MRPHTICLMMSSLDGKTDPSALSLFSDADLYDRMHQRLGGDAWLCGRVTLQADFGDYMEPEPFRPGGSDPLGRRAVHVAEAVAGKVAGKVAGAASGQASGHRPSFAVAADTHGQMLWKNGSIDGDRLIVLTGEGVSEQYLALLRARGVSYIAAGRERIDFAAAFGALRQEFGVQRLIVEGGGHLNAAILDAGLLDEFSLILVPGIDGRAGPSASFDGLAEHPVSSYPATLTSVDRLDNDVLWLRYTVRQKVEQDAGKR